MSKEKQLSQYFTPIWAAEELWNMHFADITSKDMVWEPCCGTGNMLSVIPKHIPAVGTDLDGEVANIAQHRTGRQVMVGSFLDVNIDYLPITTVFTNPPFELSIFEKLMQRLTTVLKYGNRAGFIIPAYFLQTSNSVLRLSRQWTIHQQMLPRDIFYSLTKPICFATFVRENNPKLYGFALYAETADIRKIHPEYQDLLKNGPRPITGIWNLAVYNAIIKLGGVATLDAIYKEIEGNKPTNNRWWKEKVRQTLQRSFTKVSTNLWAKTTQLY